MSDHPYTREAIELWQQGKINIFDAMAQLEDERDKAQKLADMWEGECLDQAEANGKGSEREAALLDALRNLLFFTEEDQPFASLAYTKAYKRAHELVNPHWKIPNP
jgi:hypothetical protein